jgi:ATP-dependent helicase/nuclease subunit A
MRELFAGWVKSADKRWEEVPLSISFRSAQAVLDAVDSVFLHSEAREGLTLGGEYVRHIAYRRGDAGRVELWPLIEKMEGGEIEPWKPPVERIAVRGVSSRLASLLAKKIAAMIGTEMLPARARLVEAGDIMVLVRRRGAFVADLVRELKGLNVPVAGVDRMILSQQMAVMDLLAVARFVLLPADDLTLATILKGPLIGFDEESLFTLAHGRAGTLWSELTTRCEEKPLFAFAHAELARLLGEADFGTPYAFFARLLGAGGGRKKLLSWLGPDAADPLDEFLELALAYERDHVPSLSGFLAWLEAGATEIKRNLEQSKGSAVRIMTVHGAKGLQAPIVFLPDTASLPTKTPRLLWSGERDNALPIWLPRKGMAEGTAKEALEEAARLTAEEYRRLLYVAMTRAEDQLYVCGWAGKSSPGNWHQLIEQALGPLATEIANEEEAFPVDQPILRLETAQEREIEVKAQRIETTKGGETLPSWFFAPAAAEPAPPRPLAPSRPEGEEPPVRSPLAKLDENRFLRGRLIHRLLQSLPELSAANRPAAAKRFLSRQSLDWSEEAREALVTEVMAVLDHPEFAPLFGPGSLAEVPVVGVLGERAISGQIDRLAVTASEVLIIDFKTNRPPPKKATEIPEIYRRQMEAYRQALADIWPERKIRCLLLWTDGPFITEVD